MPDNGRPVFSDSKLAVAATDVAYEFATLRNVVDLWPIISRDQALQNFGIESFLVHYRNLRDFMYPPQENRHPPSRQKGYDKAIDNVLAFDFNRQWEKLRDQWNPVVTGFKSDEKTILDRRVAHISYSRAGIPHGWPIDEMYAKMHAEFGEFLRSMPQQRRQWFSDVALLFPSLYGSEESRPNFPISG